MPEFNGGKKSPAAPNWWGSEGGFFGRDYMRGDDSIDGFLAEKKLTLAERTTSEVDGVMRLAAVGEGDTVLDCPCGYGRHSIELAKRGVSVVGQDINAIHLNAARDLAAKAKVTLPVRFEECDMRNVGHAETFDAIINMFYSYGFFASDQENFQVLKSWRAALKPGGRLLIHTEVNVPRIASGTYKLNEVRKLQSGGELIIAETYSPDTHRIEGTWETAEGSKRIKLTPYSMRVFTAEELSKWLLDAGLSKVDVFSTWSGHVYDRDSEEMIVVATR